jgi:hypothetical protein
MQKSVEIFRFQAAPESRSNHLALLDDGSITMETRDVGSNAEGMFGGERDQQFSVTVPHAALAELAFALLLERFRGQPNAVEGLRDLCRRERIPHKFETH